MNAAPGWGGQDNGSPLHGFRSAAEAASARLHNDRVLVFAINELLASGEAYRQDPGNPASWARYTEAVRLLLRVSRAHIEDRQLRIVCDPQSMLQTQAADIQRDTAAGWRSYTDARLQLGLLTHPQYGSGSGQPVSEQPESIRDYVKLRNQASELSERLMAERDQLIRGRAELPEWANAILEHGIPPVAAPRDDPLSQWLSKYAEHAEAASALAELRDRQTDMERTIGPHGVARGLAAREAAEAPNGETRAEGGFDQQAMEQVEVSVLAAAVHAARMSDPSIPPPPDAPGPTPGPQGGTRSRTEGTTTTIFNNFGSSPGVQIDEIPAGATVNFTTVSTGPTPRSRKAFTQPGAAGARGGQTFTHYGPGPQIGVDNTGRYGGAKR